MTTYAVKRHLPGITMDQLAEAQKSVIATGEEMTEAGQSIQYIRSNFYPSDSSCTCLFEAENVDTVAALNETASVPYDEIVEVLD